MEATDIEEQVERADHSELAEPGDIANDYLGVRGSPPRGLYRSGREIDPGHIPMPVRKIAAVGARAAAEIKRTARLQGRGTFDQLDQFWWGDARVPGLEPEQIGKAIEET